MSFWDDEDFHPYETGGVAGSPNTALLANADSAGGQNQPPGVTYNWNTAPGQTWRGLPVGATGSAATGEYAAANGIANQQAFDPNQQVGHNGTINGMNREQYRDAWMSSGAKSMDDLRAFVAQHGGTVQSDNGMVMTPFGEALDMGGNARGSAAGNGSFSATWGGGGGPSGDVGTGVPLNAIGVGGGSSAGAGGGGYGGHLGGSFAPFVYEDFKAPDAFKAPTEADMLVDPGYAFRRAQGERAMTNMAAKHGNLVSGEFAKGMQDYSQGLASQEYGQVYGRRASEYDRAYGNAFGTNQANNAGRLGAFTANTNADLGYGNLDLGYTRAGNDFALGQGQLALGNRQADQSFALGQGNLALGQGNLGLNWANYGLNAQGQNFNQQYSLANLGLNAANQAGQYGSSYGANGGNLITGQGNAVAAGQAGAGAAYGGALGNIGNTAMGYGLDYYANH